MPLTKGRDQVTRMLMVRGLGLVLVLFPLVPGCKGKDAELKKRVQATIQDLQMDTPDHRTLKALRAATPESLQRPQLVTASLVLRPETAFLAVYWIADSPAAGNVCILGPAAERICVEISAAYARENELAAQKLVLYYYVHVFRSSGPQWAALTRMLSTGEGDVILTTDDGQILAEPIALRVVKKDALPFEGK